MRIAIVADCFPPMRTSGAVQLHDLAQEFLRAGHSPTVIVPSPGLVTPFSREIFNGVDLLRLRSMSIKDVSNLRRAFGELLMPFLMLRNLRKSPLSGQRWDAIIWYSPSIFFGPLVSQLKKQSACPSYLILRDIFPEWAVDMGIMRRGLAYRCFKQIERYQYSVADSIGVQTPANLLYFDKLGYSVQSRLEVLQNWLAAAPNVGCSISVDDGPLAGRYIFVYAGNMGVAQGVDILLQLAERLRLRSDIGFLFVGRGSEVKRLREQVLCLGLDNIIFYDEIQVEEIPGLYSQCHAGLVALDANHKTHNVPGKFLSYLQAGLPVLASMNMGNDLVNLIEEKRVGRATTDNCSITLERLALELIDLVRSDPNVGQRCQKLARIMFSPSSAVRQISAAISPPAAFQGEQANLPFQKKKVEIQREKE